VLSRTGVVPGTLLLKRSTRPQDSQKMKHFKKKTRRSSCGAPIPSFRSELDQLERELQEDDEEDRRRRQRRDRRQQSKQQLESQQSANEAPHDAKPVSVALENVGDAYDDDDDDDDDDGLLSFSFRANGPLTVLQETKASECQIQVVDSECKENNDEDEMDHCVWDPLDEEGCAKSVPLADATNSQCSDKCDPSSVPTEMSPAKPCAQAEVLEVKCLSPTASAAVVEATKGSTSDSACPLSDAVVEIFERSDVETCTCKEVWKQLEDRYGFKLDKTAKKSVRSQLTALIQKYLDERARSESTVPSNGADPKETVNETKPDLDRNNRGCGERTTTNKEKVANDGLGSYPSHPEQQRTSDQPREKTAENGIARTIPPEKSSPKPRTKSGPESEALPVKLPVPQPKRRARRPKASKATENPKVAHEGDSRGVKRVFQNHLETTPYPTPPRKAKRNKPQCALCNACPCRHPSAAPGSSVLRLAQSDSAVEKALMRRLLKLEQASDQYEEQTEAVRRKLKKHRREMWKKRDPTNENSQKRTEYRFLPDAADMDRESAARTGSNLLDESTVLSAKSSLFSFAPTYQPTLTQMFGCQPTKETVSSDDKHDDVEPDPASDEDGQSQIGAVVSDEMPTIGGEEVDSCRRTAGSDDALDVERVEIRNGVDVTEETTRIWGAYSSAGGYKSLWDRIFDDPKEAEALTLEQLETMLDDFLPPASIAMKSSQVDVSMLTQRGQLIANEITGRVNLSPGRVERLASACPEWEENVLFALRQGSAGDVRSALEGIAEAKAKLLRCKEAILKAIEAQDDVLSVFSEALTASLTRYDPGSPVPSPGLSCSFLDQGKRASIDRGDENASEVKTLSVSSSSPTSSQEELYD
jgi:DEK C terminal domain